MQRFLVCIKQAGDANLGSVTIISDEMPVVNRASLCSSPDVPGQDESELRDDRRATRGYGDCRAGHGRRSCVADHLDRRTGCAGAAALGAGQGRRVGTAGGGAGWGPSFVSRLCCDPRPRTRVNGIRTWAAAYPVGRTSMPTRSGGCHGSMTCATTNGSIRETADFAVSARRRRAIRPR